MAEALGLYVGIVASIGSIIQLSESVVQYLRNTAKASEDKEKLLTEIFASNTLLEKLREKAGSPEWKHTLESMEAAEGPLECLKSALQALETKAQRKKNRFRKVTKHLIWHFDKAEYAEILSKIERSKSNFMIALDLYDRLSLGLISVIRTRT
jgi:F0F1-type ATP synthase delta subunit